MAEPQSKIAGLCDARDRQTVASRQGLQAGKQAQPVTSDHGRAHERREQVSDSQLANTHTSVAAEMAVDPRTDWHTTHEPKGKERRVADVARGES